MDTPVHRGGRVSAAALAVAVALAGCGGDDSASNETATAAAPTLPRALAEELALASDDVAELLEAGDGCAASERAADLHERTLAAIESGDVPAALEQPLVTAVEGLATRIACEPTTTEEGTDEDDEGDRGKGKGKAKGKDKDDDNPDGTTGTTGTTGTETVATTTTTEEG
ncbi:MAG: hypothetical protein ACRDNR_02410 [Gaiellaceae bacterium]